jgi:hypothetical protein
VRRFARTLEGRQRETRGKGRGRERFVVLSRLCRAETGRVGAETRRLRGGGFFQHLPAEFQRCESAGFSCQQADDHQRMRRVVEPSGEMSAATHAATRALGAQPCAAWQPVPRLATDVLGDNDQQRIQASEVRPARRTRTRGHAWQRVIRQQARHQSSP